MTVTTVFWLGGQWAGQAFGWDGRVALILDLAALAGFAAALVVTYRIWRARRAGRE